MKKKRLLTITLSVMIVTAMVACVSISLTADKKPDTADTESVAVSVGEDRYNILVTGSDRTSGLTDVIMLITVNRKSRTAAVMQIPRDTYAEYTDGSYKKLNGAYTKLGAEKLCELLSDSLGICIDRYLMLSPDALRETVDALGGVEITLDAPMYYKDPAQGLYISLKAGRQVLDGKTAEQFIRYRSGYADGDLGRIDAQKVFMCALFRKAKSDLDPIRLAKLTSALLGKTDTNISLSDAASLAEDVSAVDIKNISFVTAPGEAVVAKESGASYYSLSSKAMSELLSNYFGADGADFDRHKIFLNEKYESFAGVYGGYTPYKVYTAENMSKGVDGIASIAQIPIDKKLFLHYNIKS